MTDSIGVAVIGGGMAGRAHAAGYRSATTVFGTDRPDVRLVAIADMNEAVADDTAKRYGYERAEYDWRAIADAPDIDAVSVVVANHLHREIVEGLLAAGKHVLCEKPLAGSLADAEAMVAAAREVRQGHRGRLHLPPLPRRRDDPSRTRRGHPRRSGALQRPLLVRLRAGSHVADHLALQGRSRHRCARRRRQPPAGPVGVRLRTDRRGQRCVVRHDRHGAPGSTSGVTYGHTKGAVSDELAPVENEDVATFTATFENGAVGTFSASRVAHNLPDGLGFELFASKGSAAWDLHRAGEFQISADDVRSDVGGPRRVLIGPEHPYISGGLPMDAGGVGHGVADLFVYQTRAFLDQIAGIGDLGPLPGFDVGLHGLRVVAAITESAKAGGAAVKVL